MTEKILRVLEYEKIVDRLRDRASSQLGKELASEMVPLTDIVRIEEAQKETTDAVTCILRKGSPPLGGIYDIRSYVRRAEAGGMLNPGELLKIADVLRASRRLKGYLTQDKMELSAANIIYDLCSRLGSNKTLEERLMQSIENEDTLSDYASPQLASIRRNIRRMQDSIKEKLSRIIHSSQNKKYMQDAVVTIRGDRYVVPVKQEYRSEIPGLIHDSSASGATIFIEPMSVVEANNKIRELKIKEQAEIERILSELTGEVLQILTSLKSNVSILTSLDFIFAKARLSLDYNCVCPKLNNERRIVIKKGRHPLLDPKCVVPTDFWIGQDFDTLVVTGPNTGGKTVTLKTVGLFALLTQSGLHIPANEGTEMSIFKKVYADIGDEQSIEQSLSTFSSHMKNIVDILMNVDDKSLVLFDELGAGTDPTEGAALAMSILENLRQMGAVTVATTHYSQLKVYAVTTRFVENACCEFDVETLKPTYRLLIGVPGKSNAFAISKRLGLKDDIIERAKEFLTKDDIKFEDMLMSIEKNLSQTESERMRAESYRLESEKLNMELEEQRSRFAQSKEKLLNEARAEARKILIEAKNEVETIMTEMRRLEKENTLRQKNAEEMRLKLKGKIDNVEESMSEPLIQRAGLVKPPKDLKPGNSVMIVSLNQKGTVVEPPDKDGEVLVQAGIMKINVHVSNLKFVDEQKAEFKRSGMGKIGLSKARSITTEIDLRGFNIEEAIDSVDKYLDDAIIAGLGEISIIHGKGTGTLRAGIHKYLKTNPRIKAFRLGKYGEGEDGVTIVELK